MSAFEALDATHPEWGSIARMTQDSEFFGFGTARYERGGLDALLPQAHEFSAALARWAEQHGVELISTGAPADHGHWNWLLEESGFRLADLSIGVFHPNLAAAQLDGARLSVRLAGPADGEAAVEIARSAFRHGRFHTDARFPQALAHDRYAEWVRRGLESGESHRVYVLGPEGDVWGLLYATLEDGVADLRLGALDKSRQSGFAGLSLYAGALRLLRESGARQAVSRPQMSNPAVLNLYAAMGFRFERPETVWHWHAPGARHLLNLETTWENP